MTPQQVIKFFGTVRDAAYTLDYTEVGISHWLKTGKVPIKAQRMIEAMTDGKLKAMAENQVLRSRRILRKRNGNAY